MKKRYVIMMTLFTCKLCTIVMVLSAACMSTPVNSSDTVSARNIEVNMQVPDMGWKVRINEIHQMDEEIWVISSLQRHPGMAGQAISIVSDNINMDLPDLPVRHFVLGKTWNWKNKEPYTFIKNMTEIQNDLKAGQLIYRRSSE